MFFLGGGGVFETLAASTFMRCRSCFPLALHIFTCNFPNAELVETAAMALRKERGLLLHASRLAVERAPGGSRLDVEAPLPEDFARFLEGTRSEA